MATEQEWENVLQIKTSGRDDSRSDTGIIRTSRQIIACWSAWQIAVIFARKIRSSIMAVARAE